MIWGLSIFSLQIFLEHPEARVPILKSIGVAIIISLAYDVFYTDKIHKNKYLRHIISLLIINGVLIGIGIIRGLYYNFFEGQGSNLESLSLLAYLAFNGILLAYSLYRSNYYKRLYKQRLQAKVASLED